MQQARTESADTLGLAARLTTLAIAGWVYAALGLGVPLSLLHLVHGRVTSSRDALVVLAWFLVLYGGLGALIFLGAGSVRMVLHRRIRSMDVRAPVRAGIIVATTLFWGRYLHMGLTYGEVPFAAFHRPAGLLLYVAVRLLLVGLGAMLLARLLARPLTAPVGRHRSAWLATGAVVVVAHLLVPRTLDSRPADTVSPPRPPRADAHGSTVVFVGIDGADWAVLQPMIADGALPAIQRLVETGASGSLATLADANSSEIWASIYTGKPSSAHGIEDFVRVRLPGMRGPGLFALYGTFFPNLGGYLDQAGLARRATVDRHDLRAMPLWEMALVAGLPIGVVNGFYYSYPPPLLTAAEGFMVAYGAGDEARRRRALPTPFVQPGALAFGLAPALVESEVAWQRAALRTLLGARPPRFVHVYTREPDRTQHQYWKWYQPQYFLGVTDADRRRFGERIPAINREVDALIGDVLPLAGPETVIVVASDHGHSPTMLHPTLYSHHQHGPPGVVLLAGGPVRAGARLTGGHVYDLAPTILYLLGLPVPDDMAGRVLTEALRPEALAARPVRRTDSYEPWHGRIRYGAAAPSAHDAEEIRRLRALGYLQ